MLRNSVNTIRSSRDNTARIGNIQVSKGMLWANMKRAQEEANNSKLLSKIFPNKVNFYILHHVFHYISS